MITHPAFPVEPWRVRETELHFDNMAQTESVFALSNGHIGLRANLDEGEPNGLPGTYLNGFYETRPLPYAEAGFGYPEDGQTVVNVTNGKIIRLLVEDEPFDVRYGCLDSHERVLDLRAGTLRRCVEWTSPTGRRVRVTSTRLVSFTQRAVVAIEYVVEALDGSFPVVIQSELVANESQPAASRDPRAAAALAAPLLSEYSNCRGERAVLVHHTRSSNLRMAAAMDHVLDCPQGTSVEVEAFADLARLLVSADLDPGRPLRLVKFVAYGWSSQRSVDALRDQVGAAGTGARHTGWEGLLEQQRAYLDEFWERADIELDGDAELQQALRFGLFHTLQAGARGEQRSIPAKGLTGPGYDGHTFWDTEMYVLPLLTLTWPVAAADALRWRHSTLDLARARARTLGLQGAAFPWRTIGGEECSSYWPAGTAAFHINADIADAVIHYECATDDREFASTVGIDLLVETARLWRSLGHHRPTGGFRIDGVTGPDEYSAVADNNVYTNLMAQRNLRAAADAAITYPARARELGVDDDEAESWRDAADKMVIPYDPELGVHPQAEGFTSHQVWDFAHTPEDHYPLLLHYPYFDLYRKQVVKQADLTFALYACGDSFTAEEKLRDFEYYERLTVRDSSLSACTQAVVAAEVGHMELAYDYFAEAALMDLEDLEHNTRDGIHIASVAGACTAALAGFGGARHYGRELSFTPRLPAALTRLRFRVHHRGSVAVVEVGQTSARYSLMSGPQLRFTHHGQEAVLRDGQPPLELEIPPAPRRGEVQHPRGRAPAKRRPQLSMTG